MRLALAFVFFLSGSAALLFESLWFRQALIAFGSSVWASSLVLSGFMAGLALGNGGAARYGERLRDPVRSYALLELAIGGSGLGLVVGLPLLGPLLAPVFGPLLEQAVALQLLRFAFSFVLLAIPAAAMGATLPLLVRALARVRGEFGGALGFLYGWNTLGAVCGALVGELLLIDALGVFGSGCVAAGLNVLAAVGALAAVRVLAPAGPGGTSATLAASHPEAPATPPGGSRPWVLLAAAFASGLILLALQVVWFRLLVLFVSGTGRAFAVLLAVVLAGIALGGLVGGALLRARPAADRVAPGVALFAGAVVMLGYSQLQVGIAESAFNRVVILSRSGLTLAVVLMLPASFASGLLFPMIGKRLNDLLDAPVRSAGLLTLVNTVGSAIGPLVAAFALLPGLGVERSVFVLAAAYGLVALAVSAKRGRAVAGVAAALAVAWLLFPFGRMEGRYLRFVVEKGLLPGAEVVETREGLIETIQLSRLDFLGEPIAHQLMTDGYAMSSTSTQARRYMNLFVHLPLALHPDPRDALLISYGVGNTALTLTRVPGLDAIDVVDISRDILSMADRIHPERNPLRDPRVRVRVEDGRYFLQATDRRFDLITGEPPPPNLGHVAYLYTQEYFQLAHDRLAPGGLVSYWVPMHQLQMSEGAAIVAAFCAVFEDCSLWNGGSLNWILVGSRGGLASVSVESLSAQWRHPEASADLRSIGLESPASLGALFIADAEQLRDLAAPSLAVTDDRPTRIHNWSSPTEAGSALAFQDPEAARRRFVSSLWIREIWPEALRNETIAAFRRQGIVERVTGVSRETDPERRLRLLQLLLEDSSLEVLPLQLLGGDPAAVEIARASVAEALVVADRAARTLALARDDLSRRRFAAAAAGYEAALAQGSTDPLARPLSVYAHCRAGNRERAELLRREQLRVAAPLVPRVFDTGIDGCWAAAFDPREGAGLSSDPSPDPDA